jgi:GNAT superfamily N-acetyltransferase
MKVRPISSDDLPAATDLLRQLGYDMAPTETARRLGIVLRDPGHRVWVCERDGGVVGLLHAFFRPALDKAPEVMVQALVVEASQRSQRIGERLMEEAEAWARNYPSASVSLYSGSARKDAHRFYARIGYARIATSELMRKQLAGRHGATGPAGAERES